MKKRVSLAWIACFVLLMSLTACGKDSNSIIPGVWSGDWDFSDNEETIFYDDGSIEDFSWYSWSIVNGNILKIEDISGAHIYKYTIDEINNKLSQWLLKKDGEDATGGGRSEGSPGSERGV